MQKIRQVADPKTRETNLHHLDGRYLDDDHQGALDWMCLEHMAKVLDNASHTLNIAILDGWE